MKNDQKTKKAIEAFISENILYPREIAKRLNVPVQEVYKARTRLIKRRKYKEKKATQKQAKKDVFREIVAENEKYPTFGIDLKGNDLIRYWQVRAFRESCKSPHFPTRSERNAFNRKFDTNL